MMRRGRRAAVHCRRQVRGGAGGGAALGEEWGKGSALDEGWGRGGAALGEEWGKGAALDEGWGREGLHWVTG